MRRLVVVDFDDEEVPLAEILVLTRNMSDLLLPP